MRKCPRWLEGVAMNGLADRNAHLARLMGAAVVMLHASTEDVRAGRYGGRELNALADGLDQLVRALREEPPVVVEEGS